jgi:hypothetical protein
MYNQHLPATYRHIDLPLLEKLGLNAALGRNLVLDVTQVLDLFVHGHLEKFCKFRKNLRKYEFLKNPGVRGASKIKLKKVNKKRMATARRLIFFGIFSRHPLLI